MTTETDYSTWRSGALLPLVRALAESVTAGNLDQAPDLAAAAGILQYRYDSPLHQGANGARPDSGLPHVDLMRRVRWEGNGFLAVTAGEVRRAMGTRSLAGFNLCTVPASLPADDEAPVCLYSGLTGVGSLLGAVARGEGPTAAHRDVEDRAVHNRRPIEF